MVVLLISDLGHLGLMWDKGGVWCVLLLGLWAHILVGSDVFNVWA